VLERLVVPTSWHVSLGVLTLVMTTLTALFLAALVWRRRPVGRLGDALLIGTQVVLMAQVVLGVKLLDQGFGFRQNFVHYLGGLGTLLFFLVLYWLPRGRGLAWSRAAFGLALGAMSFAYMSFFIGRWYVAA
jgi:heme A synthase